VEIVRETKFGRIELGLYPAKDTSQHKTERGVTGLGVGCVLVREGSLLLCLHALNLRLQIQICADSELHHRPRHR
jgi:hypothetical protein